MDVLKNKTLHLTSFCFNATQIIYCVVNLYRLYEQWYRPKRLPGIAYPFQLKGVRPILTQKNVRRAALRLCQENLRRY